MLAMKNGQSLFQSLSFSTRGMPEKERVPYWREAFGRHIVRLEIQPKSNEPFEAQATLWAAPGLRAHWSVYKGPGHVRRTRELICSTDECIALLIDRQGTISWSQNGTDVQLARSSAVVVLHSEPAEMVFAKANYMAVMMPHKAIAPLTKNLGIRAQRYIPPGTEALALLPTCLRLVRRASNSSDPEVVDLSVRYLYDLMALRWDRRGTPRRLQTGAGCAQPG